MDTEEVINIPRAKLHVSKLNTRQPKPRDPAVKSLAKSLAEFGQTTPLIVRPHPDKKGEFEIGAGARRSVAAGVAKLDSLACVVRDLDDKTFEELILIENLQREDPDPKAEADLLERLVGGREVEPGDLAALAARCGKPESWVARRLRLLDLSPAMRKEWRGGELDGAPVEMMEFLGSLPREVQDELAENGELDCCRTRKEAKEIVDKRYTCRLDAAPFPLDDERFFGECGESGCASDSSAQPLLFGDFEQSKCGRCLNRACFNDRLMKWRTHVLTEIERGEEGLVYFSRNYAGKMELADGRTVHPLQQWELASKHKLKTGRKADKGSRRAIDLSNPDKPRSVYLVPMSAAGSGAGAVASDTTAPEVPTDKAGERRDKLQARRWAKVLEALTERLRATGVEAVTPNGDVLKLAAVFGLSYSRTFRDDSWEHFDKHSLAELEESAWGGLVGVFESRLLCGKVGDVPTVLPEMRRVAALIGFDLAAAKLAADTVLPPPKSWGDGIDLHTLEPLANEG